METKNRKDQIMDVILNHKVLSVVIVLGIIIISSGKVLESLDKTQRIFKSWISAEKQERDSSESDIIIDSVDTDTFISAKKSLVNKGAEKYSNISLGENIEMINRFVDETGKGISNIIVSCTGCINKAETVTDSLGNFSLPLNFEKKDNPSQTLRICFLYLGERKCATPRLHEINSFELPKF